MYLFFLERPTFKNRHFDLHNNKIQIQEKETEMVKKENRVE